MKIKSPALFWVVFFIVSIVLLNEVARHNTEPREIILSTQQATEIGNQLLQIRKDHRLPKIINWQIDEPNPQLGIGNFTWRMANDTTDNSSDFLALLTFIAKTHPLPESLVNNAKYPPWENRQDFLEKFQSSETRKLRYFLQDTLPEQTQFLAMQLEAKLPTILRGIKNAFTRQHVRTLFYQLSVERNGVFALIDYALFMGTGTTQASNFTQLGWGLPQVLENMDSTNDNVMLEFVETADILLTRRAVTALDANNAQLRKWRSRIQTYLIRTQ